MRKLIFMLFILFLTYFGIQFGFKLFGNGHDVKYQVISNDIKFQIAESYKMKHKNEHKNYYFTISKNDFSLKFQTYHDFGNSDYVISGLKYYADDQYQCALPIFKNDVLLFDIMCVDQSKVISYYHNLRGLSIGLDQFASSLKDVGYDVTLWDDSLEGNTSSLEFVTVYHDHIVDHHYVGLNSYKGLYTVSNDDHKKIFAVNLFSRDTYERPLSIQVGRYYLSAHYDMDYDFTTLFWVDLMYNDVRKINYHSKISFNSYFMGSIGQSAYLYDRSNKKQYEVDVRKRRVVEIGNESIGIKMYRNGEWENISVSDLSTQDLYFSTEAISLDTTGYVKVDKVGNKVSGYYYFYRLREQGYDVYRSDVMDPTLLTYLFHTSSIDNVQYVSDYVYFTEGTSVKYYHDTTGVKTLLTNTELAFNKNIFYHVYES